MLVDSASLTPGSLPREQNMQAYCGLDSSVDLEVLAGEHSDFPSTRPDASESHIVYDFERALQGPYLDLMLRGFRVDEIERRKQSDALHSRIAELERRLNLLARAVWDLDLNPRSSDALRRFFYGAMKLPEQHLSFKGIRRVSCNREALEKLSSYMYARPFVDLILLIRDLSKQAEVLDYGIDPDGRFRASYNIAGTKVGRSSSSENSLGLGGNAQNIPEHLRRIFVADPGYVLVHIDLEQTEARDVGFIEGCLFDDWTYLNACECLTGDHEVLTPLGWKFIEDKPPEIAVWYATRELKFEKVIKWNEGVATGLIQAENRSISVIGTGNHMMPVLQDRTNLIDKRSLLQLLINPNKVAPNSVLYKEGEIRQKDARIIAAFQADGTRDVHGKVHWTFKKTRKIDALKNELDSLGYKYSIYNLTAGSARFYLHAGQGQENWPKECGAEILSWDFESLCEFCSSHFIWDAAREGSNFSITGKSKTHMEWLALAYTLIGKSVTLRPHKTDYWEITVRVFQNHQYRSATIRTLSLVNPVSVYCPTVRSGFFLVRRDNKIFISGNSGDLHTTIAKLIWPTELPWTNDLRLDKSLANERKFYRDYSYRYIAKRCAHLSNYMGTAWTAARVMKVPQQITDDFQAKYCRGREAKGAYPAIEPAFPAHVRWWQWVAQQIQTRGYLVSPFGYRRDFFGRTSEDDIIRQAIAYMPENMSAARMHLGFWRIWKQMKWAELLAETYDSVTFQVPVTRLDESVEQALDLIRVPLTSPSGREYVVPGEAKTGFNWSPTDPTKTVHADGNERGLRTWHSTSK